MRWPLLLHSAWSLRGIDSAGKPLRRVPSNAEIAAGYPCGPADKQLHNEVTSRGLMAANELGYRNLAGADRSLPGGQLPSPHAGAGDR